MLDLVGNQDNLFFHDIAHIKVGFKGVANDDVFVPESS